MFPISIEQQINLPKKRLNAKEEELEGYTEYKTKVKHKIIPFI